MTSTSIYTTPYFYIIQHIESKKLYAGSKWAIGCHPDEFMHPNGYQTSSSTINTIIYQEGLKAFNVLRIDTYCDNIHPYEYETAFLRCLDCAKSPDWYNGHNNTRPPAYGTSEFTDLILSKYNVDKPHKIPNIRNKTISTNLTKYGVENPGQVELFKEKSKLTCLEKYGVEYSLQDLLVRQKGIDTHLAKYDVKQYTNREQSKQTCLEKYGVANVSNIPEVRSKANNTNLEKYGATNASQVQQFKDKRTETNLRNSGVENPSQFKFLSIIETKKSYAKNIISRVFPEFRQFY